MKTPKQSLPITKAAFLIVLFLGFLYKVPSTISASYTSMCTGVNSAFPGALTATATGTNVSVTFDVTGNKAVTVYYAENASSPEQTLGTTTSSGGTATVTGTIPANGNYLLWVVENAVPSLCGAGSTNVSITGGVAPTATPTIAPTPTGAGSCKAIGQPCEDIPSGPTSCCGQPANKCVAGTCQIAPTSAPIPTTAPFKLCETLTGTEKSNCEACFKETGEGIYTAIGCIPLTPSAFTKNIISVLISIAIGMAFVMLVYGAFLCITSRGNTQQTAACQQTITSAIVGLLMIIFSLVIVRLLFGQQGVLPGWINIF